MKDCYRKTWVAALLGGLVSGCSSNPIAIPRAQDVDINRFMGKWYVIACIPTLIEKNIYNAVESYRLDSDGTIATTFTFNKESFDGPAKQYNPRGYVVPATGNAEWKMQFIWPVKSEFIISYLDEQYDTTVIARTARDYVWIMARSPEISDSKYEELKKFVSDIGYDTSKLVKIPQLTLTKSSHQD